MFVCKTCSDGFLVAPRLEKVAAKFVEERHQHWFLSHNPCCLFHRKNRLSLAFVYLCSSSIAWQPAVNNCHPHQSTKPRHHHNHLNDASVAPSRRSFVVSTTSLLWTGGFWLSHPNPVSAKCKDVDSCREIGEQKEAANLAANPIVRLGNDGLQYKVLSTGLGNAQVSDDTTVVKIAYSLSARSRYMYSQGMGYNKIDAYGNGQAVPDLGLDGITIHLKDENAMEVPVGIRQAIMGMKRGEKRRIEVPPSLGFETRYVSG